MIQGGTTIVRGLVARLEGKEESSDERKATRHTRRQPEANSDAWRAWQRVDGLRIGWLRIGDRRHHPIPQSRHGRDVSGLPGVVAEQAPKRCHSLVDGVRRDDDIGPDLVEQVINADDLASVLGKAQQQPHRPHFYPSRLSVSRNLTGGRIDAPGTDAKRCRGGAFHAGVGCLPLSLNRKATRADYTDQLRETPNRFRSWIVWSGVLRPLV